MMIMASVMVMLILIMMLPDLGTAISSLMLLLVVDLASLIVSIAVLYHFCQVNMFKFYLYLQKEHGYAFSMQQAYLIDYLFCTIAINCAFDFTLQFDWVFDPTFDNITDITDMQMYQNGTLHNMHNNNFTSMNVISRFVAHLTGD